MKRGLELTLCAAVLGGWALYPIRSEEPSRADPAKAKRAEQWNLPAKWPADVSELAGSGAGEVICFSVMSFSPGERTGRGPRFACWMLETATNRLTDLGRLLREKLHDKDVVCSRAIPSPDAKHVVLITGPEPSRSRGYLLALKGRGIRKLAEGMPISATWSADKLYVSFAGRDGSIGPVRAYDPIANKWTELKVCGMVMAVQAAGRFLVCACHPSGAAKPLARQDLDKAIVAVVSPDGKIVTKLVPSDELSRPPALSPTGKYLAFERQKWHGRDRPPEILGTRIVSSDGKSQRDVKGIAPVAVTDQGEMIGAVPGRPGLGAQIKFIDRTGKATTVAANAQAATVCSDRLFYVTAERPPTSRPSDPVKLSGRQMIMRSIVISRKAISRPKADRRRGT